jgi:16S rRNA (cytosine1402-N4)-methyltransferase
MKGGMEGFADVLHLPVLCQESIDALNIQDGGRYVDGTFGLGGYSREILSRAKCSLVSFDRDPFAVTQAGCLIEKYGTRFSIMHGCFGDMDDLLSSVGIHAVDSIVLDLGVSSPQLDDPDRGFSFRFDGPLDMRMGSEGITAEDIINTKSEGELADIIFTYGEERLSRRVSRAIILARSQERITRTKTLADIVRRVVPRSRKGRDNDPATRTFQALRIFINDELGELRRGLEAAEKILMPGGRLAVVAFHSLEDRCVKKFFAQRHGQITGRSRHAPPENPSMKNASFKVITKKPIYASPAEVASNPRARSARLRVAERTSEPSWSEQV